MTKWEINYTLTAPLSHIGETASTGSYFQTVLTNCGRLPVITANAIRGKIRDCGAKYFLDTIHTKVDKEVFHVLFSGGNLSGTMKNDIEKAKKAREMFPLVSLLGGGLGDMILQGKLNLTFAYPICQESEEITKISSDISWHNLIEEIDFSRMDDSKNDNMSHYISDMEAESTGKASTQMRYSVQYIAAGTEFVQTLMLGDTITAIERGALLSAIAEWFKIPTLGGMASKGFGYFDAALEQGKMSVKNGDVNICQEYADDIAAYNNFLSANSFEPFFYLLKGGKKGGKGTNEAVEGSHTYD